VDYSLFSSEIIKQPDVCMNNTVENDFFWISQGKVATCDR